MQRALQAPLHFVGAEDVARYILLGVAGATLQFYEYSGSGSDATFERMQRERKRRYIWQQRSPYLRYIISLQIKSIDLYNLRFPSFIYALFWPSAQYLYLYYALSDVLVSVGDVDVSIIFCGRRPRGQGLTITRKKLEKSIYLDERRKFMHF